MITLTARQLREALELVNPDGETDQDQLDTEITIVSREAFTCDEGSEMPKGLYCLITEYPEEGLYGPLE